MRETVRLGRDCETCELKLEKAQSGNKLQLRVQISNLRSTFFGMQYTFQQVISVYKDCKASKSVPDAFCSGKELGKSMSSYSGSHTSNWSNLFWS